MAVFDSTIKGSPAWWVKTLSDRLDERSRRYQELEDYDIGNHPMEDVGSSGKEAVHRFIKKARANYVSLINESVREKIRVYGIRTAADRDENGDQEAEKLRHANGLAVGENLLHHDTVTLGEGYVMVVPDKKIGARISIESARDTITATDPTDRRITVAALKRWIGDDDYVHAVLQLGDKLYYALGNYTPQSSYSTSKNIVSVASWTWETAPATNPLGRPSVVRFINRPRTRVVKTSRGYYTDTLAEAEDVLEDQDRINQQIYHRLVISASQAFRQRWIKLGNAVLSDEAERSLNSDPGAVWAIQGDVEFGDFSSADIRQILDAQQEDVKTISALSRTPPHYLLGGMVNIGAEALHAAKDGFAGKVRDRCTSIGESWAEVYGMAFELMGLTDRSDASMIEIIWEPIDPATLAEKADAMVKLSAVLPLVSNLREIGQFSPAAIERILQERDQEDFDNAVRQVLNGGSEEESPESPGGTEPSPPADSGNTAG